MKLFTVSHRLISKNRTLAVFILLLLVLVVLPAYATEHAAPVSTGVDASTESSANTGAVAETMPGATKKAKKPGLTARAKMPAAATSAAGSSYMLQLFSGLMLVLLSIIALAWLAKRFNRLQPAGNAYLQVIGGLSMGAREKVVVVQAGDTRVLLGVAPGRVNMLHVLDDSSATVRTPATQPESPHENHTAQQSFSQNLAASLIRGRQ